MLLGAAVVGCGDARVELTAADALTRAATGMRAALDEYHHEVSRQDDRREADVVQAFIDRVRRDANDDKKLDAHATAFAEALGHIRNDREVERTRRDATATHIDALLEVAAGLRRVGVANLTLEDEMRRYLEDWMERQSDEAPTDTAAGSP
jgi:hypothetical protein